MSNNTNHHTHAWYAEVDNIIDEVYANLKGQPLASVLTDLIVADESGVFPEVTYIEALNAGLDCATAYYQRKQTSRG